MTRWRAIFTYTSMWMVLQTTQKEAYVTEALSKYVTTLRNKYRGKKKNGNINSFLCFCLHVYYTKQCIADIFLLCPSFLLQGVEFGKCACLMLAVWRDALWQAEASLGATCPSLPMPVTPPYPLSTLTSPGRGKKGHPSVYQWCWMHPLTRGGHWLTADASPMLPSFWATETKDGDWVDVGVSSFSYLVY